MRNFVGVTLYGFCNGFFGSSCYEDKIVVAQGDDWVVAKYSYGGNTYPVLAHFYGNWKDEMETLLLKWMNDD